MLRNVFAKTLRDESRPLLWWVIGIAALTLYLLAFYPTVRDNSSYADLLKAMPDSMKAMLNLVEDPTTPAGYVNAEFLGLTGPLLFMINAIAQGAHAIAGEEERGTLDLLLANPVPRAKVVIEKFYAICVVVGLLGLLIWLLLWVGGVLVQMHLSASHLAAATINMMLLGLLFGALALCVGSATGKRGLSIGIAAAVGIVSFVWNSTASTVDSMKPWRVLSPFYHYLAGEPLRYGFDARHAAVLVAGTLIFLAFAVVAFDRRDLAV